MTTEQNENRYSHSFRNYRGHCTYDLAKRRVYKNVDLSGYVERQTKRVSFSLEFRKFSEHLMSLFRGIWNLEFFGNPPVYGSSMDVTATDVTRFTATKFALTPVHVNDSLMCTEKRVFFSLFLTRPRQMTTVVRRPTSRVNAKRFNRRWTEISDRFLDGKPSVLLRLIVLRTIRIYKRFPCPHYTYPSRLSTTTSLILWTTSVKSP